MFSANRKLNRYFAYVAILCLFEIPRSFDVHFTCFAYCAAIG
jgi:hypothetical protein